MRAIVILLGLYPGTHGKTVGRFQYVEKYGFYVLDGAPLSASSLDSLMDGRDWERLIEEYGARIRVKLVPHNDMKKARAALASKTDTLPEIE
jgi:hypothetical protein